MQIRRCEAADAKCLDWSPQQHYQEHFEKQFNRQRNGETAVLVAVDSGQLIGRVILDIAEGEPDEMWVYALAVKEAHRRRGVGTALMHAAAGEARRIGAVHLCLTVEKANMPAIALYDRLGLIRTGEDMGPGLKDRAGRVIHPPAPRWVLRWRMPGQDD